MIRIIGGGPCGLHAAKILAQGGERVSVYEEHSRVGEPVQCTGIVTQEILRDARPEARAILNRTRHAQFCSRRHSACLPARDLVIDRAAFDRQLAEEAESAGAHIFSGKRAGRIPKGTVIGADGPASIVRKALNPNIRLRFLTGKQAVVTGTFEPDTYSVHFGSCFPGFFGWVVPESRRRARVGTAAYTGTAKVFENFLKAVEHRKVLGYQSGLIPVYRKMRLQSGRLYIVGDAAAQVKATTGGGLVPGLECARILAESILEGKSYQRAAWLRVGPSLELHRVLRNALDRFTDDDYNCLARMLAKPGMQRALGRHSRDSAFSLAFRAVATNPGLLRFLPRLVL